MSALPGAAIAAVALLVAACQAAPPPGEGAARPASISAGTDHPVPRAAPAPAVARGSDLPDPTPDAEAILTRRLAALGQAPIETPADLVGRTARQVEALLGNPDLARQEEPAEIWQYAGDRCVLNLFLYAREDGRRAVNHAELRARDPSAPLTAEPCLKDLIQERVRAAG